VVELAEQVFHEVHGVLVPGEGDPVAAGRDADRLERFDEPQVPVLAPEKGLQGAGVVEGELLGGLLVLHRL
jgi:hypothetical protein